MSESPCIYLGLFGTEKKKKVMRFHRQKTVLLCGSIPIMFSVGCFWLPLIFSFNPFKYVFFLSLQAGCSLIVSYPFWIPKQYQFEAFLKNEGIVFGCEGADEGGFLKSSLRYWKSSVWIVLLLRVLHYQELVIPKLLVQKLVNVQKIVNFQKPVIAFRLMTVFLLMIVNW